MSACQRRHRPGRKLREQVGQRPHGPRDRDNDATRLRSLNKRDVRITRFTPSIPLREHRPGPWRNRRPTYDQHTTDLAQAAEDYA
jgi:hypothetical protein